METPLIASFNMLLGSLCSGLICGGLYLLASARRVAVPDSEQIAGTLLFSMVRQRARNPWISDVP